jgi:hypothetical protein
MQMKLLNFVCQHFQSKYTVCVNNSSERDVRWKKSGRFTRKQRL